MGGRPFSSKSGPTSRGERVCQMCGDTFLGGSASRYCLECKVVVRREYEKEYSRKKRRI